MTVIGLIRTDAETFTPPPAVRAAARRALEVRKKKPSSQRGMTAVGLARANQLANGRPVSLGTIKRMNKYFIRHESDKKGSTWSDQGKGWQAWNGWGGDPGKSWVSGILRKQEASRGDRMDGRKRKKGSSKKLIGVCWKGYEAVGMKQKNGKSVPNCVPVGKSK